MILVRMSQIYGRISQIYGPVYCQSVDYYQSKNKSQNIKVTLCEIIYVYIANIYSMYILKYTIG